MKFPSTQQPLACGQHSIAQSNFSSVRGQISASINDAGSETMADRSIARLPGA